MNTTLLALPTHLAPQGAPQTFKTSSKSLRALLSPPAPTPDPGGPLGGSVAAEPDGSPPDPPAEHFLWCYSWIPGGPSSSPWPTPREAAAEALREGPPHADAWLRLWRIRAPRASQYLPDVVGLLEGMWREGLAGGQSERWLTGLDNGVIADLQESLARAVDGWADRFGLHPEVRAEGVRRLTVEQVRELAGGERLRPYSTF